MPMDMNWFSSVNVRSIAIRLSKCAPEPNSMYFLPVLHPMQYRHIGRNAEIAGDVEHPKLAAGFGKLASQIANIGIVELAEIDFRAPRPVVPPDRIGIALHQFEEALDDGFLERVAGGAAVGIGVDLAAGPLVEKIKQAGRKIFEAPVAQRPDRRPFDFGRGSNGAGVGGCVRDRASSPGRAAILRIAEQQNVVGREWLRPARNP